MVSYSAKLDSRTKQHTQFGVSASNGSRDMGATKVAEKKRKKKKKRKKNEHVQNYIASPTGIAKKKNERKELVPHMALSIKPTCKDVVLWYLVCYKTCSFFYEWEHRTGTMCPFLSLHPLGKGKEMQWKEYNNFIKYLKRVIKKIMPSGP